MNILIDMLTKKSLSTTEFQELLNSGLNRRIWRAIHPAAGWLIFDMGEKIIGHILNEKGEETPYEQGEIVLRIKGNWVYRSRGKVVQSRQVRENETQKEYFDRIESLLENRQFEAIVSIEVGKNQISLLFDNGDQLVIQPNAYLETLAMSIFDYDLGRRITSAKHVRIDENSRKPILVTSD